MSGTRLFSTAAALLAVALSSARAEDPPQAGTVPSDPIFNALLVDGSTASGLVRRLDDKGGVTLVSAEGAERTIPTDRLVKLTRDGASPPTPNEWRDVVLFPDGDRLAHCKVGQAGEFNLGVQSPAFEELAVPLDSLLGLILDPDPASVDALTARVRSEPRDSELLWLANGDKLPGLFAGLDEKTLTFQPPTGKVELPRAGVMALGFAPGQVVYRRPAGPFFELTLVDGSRIGVTGARLDRGRIVATTRFKAEVRLPIGDLARVHAINASALYLSDREASATSYEPYIGPTRPYRRNSTVAGEAIRLGGVSYDRGLGTQSRTLMAYKLEPGSKRFQATVGVDDRAGPLGNVVFKVRVDDKILFESPPMAAGEAPRAVDVDLAGAGLLILMTEFGERGDVQDLADWAEARIIR